MRSVTKQVSNSPRLVKKHTYTKTIQAKTTTDYELKGFAEDLQENYDVIITLLDVTEGSR